MQFLSEETIDLLHQLYQTPSFFEKPRGKPDSPISLLERIGQSAEPVAILPLLYFVFADNQDIALAAAKAIHTIVSQLPMLELASLDEHVRKISFNYRDVWGWNKIHPGSIAFLGHLKEYQASVLGVCSFHNNGYVREKAVNKLAYIWTGKELPFLLIRLNDWVVNVREAANTAVGPRLQPGYASHFVDCLALVMQLSNRERIVQSSIVGSIRRLLQMQASLPALRLGFQSQDFFVRRPCYQIALDAKTIPLEEIIQLGIGDPDNRIRLLSVQKIRLLGENQQAVQLLPKVFRQDSCMPVRREALQILIEKFPEQAAEELERALLDSHWSLRGEARYWIAKSKSVDFAAYYRDALARGDEISPAIGGLGETGAAADAQLIAPFAAHPLTKIRREAVKALAKLDPKAYTDLFLRALFDPSASVSREAARILILNRHLLNPEQLWNELKAAPQAYLKKNLLFLFGNLSKWDSIFYLVKASVFPDEFIANDARQRINHWLSTYNKSYLRPTAVQRTNLLMLLAENKDHLDFQIRMNIEFLAHNI